MRFELVRELKITATELNERCGLLCAESEQLQNQLKTLHSDRLKIIEDHQDLAQRFEEKKIQNDFLGKELDQLKQERNLLQNERDVLYEFRYNQRWLVKDSKGLNLLLDKESLVDLHVFHHDRWERDRLEYLVNLIENLANKNDENFYFFDVGSYFGQYALVVKLKFPAIKTIAIEANYHNYIQLRANLLINDFVDTIKTFNRCVSDKIGRTGISKPLHDNRGGTSVGDPFLGDDQSELVVENLVFDEEFKEISNSVIFMKMDIEGSEPAALLGMKFFAGRNKMIIQIEDWEFPKGRISGLLQGMEFALIRDMAPDFFYANFEIPVELKAASS
jgi:FkbM family methyltransferase